MLQLLKNPIKYFRDFDNFYQEPILVYLSYYLIAYAQSSLIRILGSTGLPNNDVGVGVLLYTSLFYAILTAVTLFIVFYFWLILGVKSIKRDVPIGKIINSIGFALFWPSIMNIIGLCVLIFGKALHFKIFIILSLIVFVVSYLWGLVNIAIAFKYAHRLNTVITILIIVCSVAFRYFLVTSNTFLTGLVPF